MAERLIEAGIVAVGNEVRADLAIWPLRIAAADNDRVRVVSTVDYFLKN